MSNVLDYDFMMAKMSLGDRNFQFHYNLTGPPSYMNYGYMITSHMTVCFTLLIKRTNLVLYVKYNSDIWVKQSV